MREGRCKGFRKAVGLRNAALHLKTEKIKMRYIHWNIMAKKSKVKHIKIM